MKKILLTLSLLSFLILMLASCYQTNKTYKVTFYLDTNEVYLIKEVKKGEKVLEPSSPSKTNLSFEYWMLEDKPYTFDYLIESDIDLYVYWTTEIKHNVKLYDQTRLLKTLEVDFETRVDELPNDRSPELEMDFLGWYIDSELKSKIDNQAIITSDLILYGKWSLKNDEKNVLDIVITEDGLYTSKDEVALYIVTFFKLPSNYMTKSIAGGQNGSGIKYIWTTFNKASIGGDSFGNREGLLPQTNGLTFIELDIDYEGISRGAKRIVYSSDFSVYYTSDHYDSFLLYDKETRTWISY